MQSMSSWFAKKHCAPEPFSKSEIYELIICKIEIYELIICKIEIYELIICNKVIRAKTEHFFYFNLWAIITNSDPFFLII